MQWLLLSFCMKFLLNYLLLLVKLSAVNVELFHQRPAPLFAPCKPLFCHTWNAILPIHGNPLLFQSIGII